MSRTVLNVEDSLDDVLLLKRACKKAGADFKLCVAEDGEIAVGYLMGRGEYADGKEHPLPDLILLDLKMPRKDGLEVLQWLKTDANFRSIPVAVFTSSTNSEDINGAITRGADWYLAKPMKFESLVSIVAAIDSALRKGQKSLFLALSQLPECCATGAQGDIEEKLEPQ